MKKRPELKSKEELDELSLIERIELLLIDIYCCTDEPIETPKLWRGRKYERLHTDWDVGKNYPLESFLRAGVLRVVESLGKVKKVVVWDTRYPDLKMAELVYANKQEPKSKKKEAVEVVAEVEPTQVETREEKDLIDIKWILNRFDVEHAEYNPIGDTINRIKSMIWALEHNAKEGWCHKSKLFTLLVVKNGEKVLEDTLVGDYYTRKRCVELGLLERNEKKKSQYRCIAEYDDIDVYARTIGFVMNYLGNKKRMEEKRAERIAEAVVETPVVVEEVIEEVVTVAPTQEAETPVTIEDGTHTQYVGVLTELYEKNLAEAKRANELHQQTNELNKKTVAFAYRANELHQQTNELLERVVVLGEKSQSENLENMSTIIEATVKLTETALSLRKNNFISSNDE